MCSSDLLGLRDDLNLDLVGLAVRVNPELTLKWEDYQALENASKTDLNGLRDDFMDGTTQIEG